MRTLATAAVVLSTMLSSAFAHENGTIKVYDSNIGMSAFKPGRLVIDDGKRAGLFPPKNAAILYSNLEKIRDYYFQNHNRKSWDDRGADIVASVNAGKFAFIDIFGLKQNAAWIHEQNRFVFGVGDKKGLDDFESALDVVAHEYTHAVIQTTSNLKYEGQSGALNEHFADVFGSLINQHYNRPLRPYTIGSSVLRGPYRAVAEALRDMMNPALGLSPQPGSMMELAIVPGYTKYAKGCVPTAQNDLCGVHILSGIPNRLSALIMSKIDRLEASNLFYNVMTERLKVNSNFEDYRLALLDECKSFSSDVCPAVESAVKVVFNDGLAAFR